MKMTKKRWFVVALVGLGAAGWAVACDTSTEGTAPTSTSGTAGSGGTGGGTGGSTGGLDMDSGSHDCTSSAECDGGVCHQGSCCESAAAACKEGCCGAGEVCLFEQCVTPGDPCYNANDCPDGHYCEPALGGDPAPVDAGTSSGSCTQPLPPAGACVPLPPLCAGDAGVPDGGCIEPCEYHPPAGQLHSIVEWQWGYDPPPTEHPAKADVWSTPTVARIYDANCDGKVDISDPPNVVFVSGDAKGTCCSCGGYTPSTCLTGVLRLLDGSTGKEIWSLERPEPTSIGFAGMSVAIGDVDGDEWLDIVAMSGEGHIVVVNSNGQVKGISDQPAGEAVSGGFGWGGGIALGDMDGDGWPEIANGRSLFTYDGGAVTRAWIGTGGLGGESANWALSHFVDLDLLGDGQLELLAGRTAYRKDGTMLWNNTTITDGFTAVGDFDDDGLPEVVLVTDGTVRLLEGATGDVELGPLALPGTGNGGPPTVADFNGDGQPEIGVAMQNRYTVLKPSYAGGTIDVLWWQTNHDMSSSVTGSSVFDFDGDGRAEVIYNDECYLWVYDGTDGTILFTSYTQSFTATEASIVADVDGDGHAEMLIISNGANPENWTCAHHDQLGKIVPPHSDPFPVWEPASGGIYRGITVLGDAQNAWVGTRTLWNQHAYHVTNICDPRDSACVQGYSYGQLPAHEKPNWQLPWLNNFRQNVQEQGLFDAPDVTVALSAICVSPVQLSVSVRNIGLSGLPAGVIVAIFKLGPPEQMLGTVTTSHPLLPGQTEVIEFVAPAAQATTADQFQARVVIDPDNPTFRECRDDNNESEEVRPDCVR